MFCCPSFEFAPGSDQVDLRAGIKSQTRGTDRLASETTRSGATTDTGQDRIRQMDVCFQAVEHHGPSLEHRRDQDGKHHEAPGVNGKARPQNGLQGIVWMSAPGRSPAQTPCRGQLSATRTRFGESSARHAPAKSMPISTACFNILIARHEVVEQPNRFAAYNERKMGGREFPTAQLILSHLQPLTITSHR